MQKHFGFGNRNNLLLTALYGFMYMFAAWSAGPARAEAWLFLFPSSGLFRRVAWHGGGRPDPESIGLFPRGNVSRNLPSWWFGRSACASTWPTLQGIVEPARIPRRSGPDGGHLQYCLGRRRCRSPISRAARLLERFGGETLFWLAAGLHLIQLMLLGPLQKLSAIPAAAEPVTRRNAETTPPLNPRPIAKARTFLRLAWIANPFAYVAIFGILPVIPKLSEHLGLTPTYAGLVFSVWFWVRLGRVSSGFGCWPGWHYHFGWLFGAFLALIGSFAAIFLCTHVWQLIVAQVVFGLAVGLIYYSSLFYSMDAGESKGKGGGIHEAAIGLGTMLGPARRSRRAATFSRVIRRRRSGTSAACWSWADAFFGYPVPGGMVRKLQVPSIQAPENIQMPTSNWCLVLLKRIQLATREKFGSPIRERLKHLFLCHYSTENSESSSASPTNAPSPGPSPRPGHKSRRETRLHLPGRTAQGKRRGTRRHLRRRTP